MSERNPTSVAYEAGGVRLTLYIHQTDASITLQTGYINPKKLKRVLQVAAHVACAKATYDNRNTIIRFNHSGELTIEQLIEVAEAIASNLKPYPHR